MLAQRSFISLALNNLALTYFNRLLHTPATALLLSASFTTIFSALAHRRGFRGSYNMHNFQYLIGALAAVMTVFFAKDAGNYALDRYHVWKTITYTPPSPSPPPTADIADQIDWPDAYDILIPANASSVSPEFPQKPPIINNNFPIREPARYEASVHQPPRWFVIYQLIVSEFWFVVMLLSSTASISAAIIWGQYRASKANPPKLNPHSVSRQPDAYTNSAILREIKPRIPGITVNAIRAEEAAIYQEKLRNFKRTVSLLQGQDRKRFAHVQQDALERQASNMRRRFDDTLSRKDWDYARLENKYDVMKKERDETMTMLNVHRSGIRTRGDRARENQARKQMEDEQKAREEKDAATIAKLQKVVQSLKSTLEAAKREKVETTQKLNKETNSLRSEANALKEEAQSLKSKLETTEREKVEVTQRLNVEIDSLRSEVNALEKEKAEMEDKEESAVMKALESTDMELKEKNKALAEVAVLKRKLEDLKRTLRGEAPVALPPASASTAPPSPLVLPESRTPSIAQSFFPFQPTLLSQTSISPSLSQVPPAPLTIHASQATLTLPAPPASRAPQVPRAVSTPSTASTSHAAPTPRAPLVPPPFPSVLRQGNSNVQDSLQAPIGHGRRVLTPRTRRTELLPSLLNAPAGFSFRCPATIMASVPEAAADKPADGLIKIPMAQREAKKVEQVTEEQVTASSSSTPNLSQEQAVIASAPNTPIAPQEQTLAPSPSTPITSQEQAITPLSPLTPGTPQQPDSGHQDPTSSTGVKKKVRRGGKKVQKKKAAALRRAALNATVEAPPDVAGSRDREEADGTEASPEMPQGGDVMDIEDDWDAEGKASTGMPEDNVGQNIETTTGLGDHSMDGVEVDSSPPIGPLSYWENKDDLYEDTDDKMDSIPPNLEQDTMMDDGEVPNEDNHDKMKEEVTMMDDVEVPNQDGDEEMKEKPEELDQETSEMGNQSEQDGFQQTWNVQNQPQPAPAAREPTTEDEWDQAWADHLNKQMEELTVQSEFQDSGDPLVVADQTQPLSPAPPAAQESDFNDANIRPPWFNDTATSAYTVVTGSRTPAAPSIHPAPSGPSALTAVSIDLPSTAPPAPAGLPISLTAPVTAPVSAAPTFIPKPLPLPPSLAPPYVTPTSGGTLAPPYILSTSDRPRTHPAPNSPVQGSSTATPTSTHNPSARIRPTATPTTLNSLLGPSPTTHPAPHGPVVSSHQQQTSQLVYIPGLMFPTQLSLTAPTPYGQTVASAQAASSPSSSESSTQSPPPASPQLLPSAPIGLPGRRPMRSTRSRSPNQSTATRPPPQSLLSTEPIQLPGLQTQYVVPESAKPYESLLSLSSEEPPSLGWRVILPVRRRNARGKSARLPAA